MVNLTNKHIASVKPPRDKKYIRLWDDNIKGFGLRVTDNGVKSLAKASRRKLNRVGCGELSLSRLVTSRMLDANCCKSFADAIEHRTCAT